MNPNKFVNQYSKYISSVEQSLNYFKEDLEHMAEGGELFYALDFSELFYFLHPFADLNINKSITSIPGEDVNDALIREQIALNYLINHLDGTKIILPPYLVELRDHIRLLRNNVIRPKDKKRQEFEKYLIDAIYKNTHYPLLKKLVENNTELSTIGNQFPEEFMSFVKSDFKPLYLALTMSPAEIASLLESITRLFRSQKISDFQNVFPESEDEFENIKYKAKQWYELLRQKNNPERDYARYIDGLACAYVDRITKDCNKNGKKLLLVTRSQRMEKIFNSNIPEVTTLRSSQSGHFRNLDYLMTCIRYSRLSPEEARFDINLSLESIGKIKEKLKGLSESKEKRHISLLQDDIIALSNSKENLFIALANKGINIENEFPRGANIKDKQLKILEKIYLVVVKSPVLGDTLIEESRMVSTRISQNFNYLWLNLEKNRIHRLSKWIFLRGTETNILELQPLSSELPVELTIEDPQLYKIAVTMIGNGKSKDNVKLREDIISSLLIDSSGKSELFILRSYLFALINSYDEAFDEIEIGLHRQPPVNILREMLVLKMMYARKTNKTIEGIKAYMDNLTIAEKDPRLKREFSVLIWQFVKTYENDHNEVAMSTVEQLIDQKPSMQLSINLVRDVLNYPISTMVRAQTLNSLSYYLSEQYKIKQDHADLHEARQRMEELNTLWPRSKWLSRFYHTEGWIAFLYAKNRIDQEENLKLAINSIFTALKDKKASPREKLLWQEHLKMAALLYEEISGNSMKIPPLLNS